MTHIIDDVFSRYLLDHDPHHVERFWREAYSSGFTQRPDLTMMGVVSGLEMACWDIIGKAAGKPVYELLGGRVHERLRSYTYLYPKNRRGEYDYDDPDLAAECAAQNVQRGFTAVKFDPAGPYTAYSGHQLSMEVLDRCETFCRKVREAVGSKADLLFGTHGQMVPSSAIRLAKRLEKYDPLWFEEPVPPGQEGAMAQVAAHTSIPIAAGERLTTKYEFFKLLEARRRVDPATERRARRWIARSEEGGKHRRGVLRADRAAPLQRAGRCRGQHPACDLHAQLPDPGKHRHVGRLSRRKY